MFPFAIKRSVPVFRTASVLGKLAQRVEWQAVCPLVGRDVVWDNSVVPHCASQHAQLLTGFRRAYCLQNQGASLKRRSTLTTLHGAVSQNTDAHLHLVLSLRMHGVIHPRPHTPSWRSANVRAAVCSEPRTLRCCGSSPPRGDAGTSHNTWSRPSHQFTLQ
jgi:hypothetical protein